MYGRDCVLLWCRSPPWRQSLDDDDERDHSNVSEICCFCSCFFILLIHSDKKKSLTRIKYEIIIIIIKRTRVWGRCGLLVGMNLKGRRLYNRWKIREKYRNAQWRFLTARHQPSKHLLSASSTRRLASLFKSFFLNLTTKKKLSLKRCSAECCRV